MRTSRIKAKLARNQPVMVTTLHLTDPSVYELTGLLGFDGIWMDLEHHPTSLETAATLMRAARVGGADVMARPAKGEFMRMARLLEIGAQGIMYPRCESADEAREVVRWAKFAPLGTRGFDGGNPDMPYCSMPMDQYVAEANAQTFLLLQIEDPASLEQVEQIASVEGVDVLFLGIADFSILSGHPGQFDHPCIREAVDRVAAAARSAGIHWGMPCFGVEHAQSLLEKGARFLPVGADIVMIKDAQERIQAEFAPLGFTFNNQLSDSKAAGAKQ
jgi:4-hydroxy-2-oxoheptanedioate aldolase